MTLPPTRWSPVSVTKQLHAALVVEYPGIRSRELIFEKLRSYRIGAMMNKDHPLAARRAVTVGEVLAEPLVVFSRKEYSDYHSWLTDLLDVPSRKLRIAQECDGVSIGHHCRRGRPGHRGRRRMHHVDGGIARRLHSLQTGAATAGRRDLLPAKPRRHHPRLTSSPSLAPSPHRAPNQAPKKPPRALREEVTSTDRRRPRLALSRRPNPAWAKMLADEFGKKADCDQPNYPAEHVLQSRTPARMDGPITPHPSLNCYHNSGCQPSASSYRPRDEIFRRSHSRPCSSRFRRPPLPARTASSTCRITI